MASRRPKHAVVKGHMACHCQSNANALSRILWILEHMKYTCGKSIIQRVGCKEHCPKRSDRRRYERSAWSTSCVLFSGAHAILNDAMLDQNSIEAQIMPFHRRSPRNDALCVLDMNWAQTNQVSTKRKNTCRKPKLVDRRTTSGRFWHSHEVQTAWQGARAHGYRPNFTIRTFE